MLSRVGLRGKLIFAAIILILIPQLLTLGVASNYFKNSSISNQKRWAISNTQNLGQNISLYFDTAANMSTYMLSNRSILDYLSSFQMTGEAVSSIQEYNASQALIMPPVVTKYTSSYTLYTLDGSFMRISTHISKLTDEQRQLADSLNGGAFYETELSKDGNYSSLVMCRLIRNPLQISQKLGYLKIYLNFQAMREVIQQSTENPENYSAFLFDVKRDSWIASMSNGDLSPLSGFKTNIVNKQNNLRPVSVNINSRPYLATSYQIRDSQFALVTLTSDAPFQMTMRDYYSIFLISLGICIFCIVLFSIILNRSIIHPLRKVGDSMRSIGQEKFGERLDLGGSKEIRALGSRFNDMSAQLVYLYRELYAEQIKLRDAELAALESDINPHFLYNTLDNIYWMADSGATTEVMK